MKYNRNLNFMTRSFNIYCNKLDLNCLWLVVQKTRQRLDEPNVTFYVLHVQLNWFHRTQRQTQKNVKSQNVNHQLGRTYGQFAINNTEVLNYLYVRVTRCLTHHRTVTLKNISTFPVQSILTLSKSRKDYFFQTNYDS